MNKVIAFLIVSLLPLALLFSGVYNLYNSIHYRTFPVTTLADTPASSLPTFVTLKDITFDVGHMLKLKYGSEVLYIPVRSRGAPPESPYDVVIFTSDAKLIAAAESQSAEMLARVLALAQRTEVTGRVVGDSSTRKSLHEALPLISKDVTIIDEGATPSAIFGAVMLVIGVALSALVMAAALRKATPSIPPAPSATPPPSFQ